VSSVKMRVVENITSSFNRRASLRYLLAPSNKITHIGFMFVTSTTFQENNVHKNP